MPRWKKYTLITVVTILGLLLLSMLIVPWQIKVQGSKWFQENSSRQLQIEKAFFNPFALTVEVGGVTLTEQQSSKTFVSLDRFKISASSRSLIDLALIIDRVELDAPYVNIELLGKQEFNFSDFTRLGENTPQPASEEPSEPLQFSFNNIVVNDGKIDFTDHTSPKKSQHQVTELSLSVPFIGNVPYLTDEYVEPQLRLLLNGSEISAAGQLKPFHQSLDTSVSMVLNEIDLAFYAFHSPVPLPVDVRSGSLDTQIDLSYRISQSEEPKLFLGGELALSDIDIRQLDGAELLRLPTLILDLDWADLMQREFNLVSLDIYEPELTLHRDAAGKWNVQQLTTAQKDSPSTADESGEEKTELPLLNIVELALHDGKVHFQDQLPPGGVSEEIYDINLRLTDLSTLFEQKTGLNFWLATERQLTSEINGDIGINPPTAAVDLVINSLPLSPYYPYLAETLTAPPGGNLNLAAHIDYSADGNVQVKQAQLGLHQLELPFTDQDAFTLSDLQLSGGSFDLQQRQATLSRVNLSGGKLVATRFEDGSLSPLKLLRPQPELEKSQPSGKPSPEPPFAVQIGQFELENFDLQFTDRTLPRKPQLKVAQLNLSLGKLAYPESDKSPFKLSARQGRKGSITVSGTLAHSPLRVQAQSQVKALALADFNDFLPDNVNVSLKDGKLYTSVAVKLQEQPDTLAGSFNGNLTITDFNLRDPLGEGELLAWENLNLNGIKGELAPFALAIDKVALSNYLARIQIDPQGRINLTSVTTAREAEQLEQLRQEQADQPDVTTPEETLADDSPPADIRIDALTLQGGTVSFIDRSLSNTFSATMYELGGRITGMASDEQMQADVDLRGELENHSPLTISGKLNPLSKDLFADLTISFKDIDLAPMTPYSGTYLGYVIDKGKLYLDLNYHIEHQIIKADNRIMIDQFTFGDSVKSDKATSLPVKLAIALLKDSNDEIHLDVPISGDLNDPSFSIAGTIFTVLKNLLVKAATAPFSLLASMLGGGGDKDFTNLSFTSGVARLDQVQQEKLGKLAAMLAKRPSLTLEISGYADPDKDPEAYRQEQLRQKILEAKWQRLKEDGQAPESRELLEIAPEEYPEYLLTVYKESDFPRPRNFVGLLKSLPDEEMEKLLLANIRADESDMKELAKNRALSVRDQLIAANEAIKPQIFLKSVDVYQPPAEGPASRVEFNIAVK